jgi:dTDP-4-dehydrorhamnose reductase
MKALVFGKTGQVARELEALATPLGWTLVQLGRDTADLADADAITSAIARAECDAVLNAAAYTAVDQAESERDAAFAVNAYAPRAMAKAAAARGLPFVHVSTDFVFDGRANTPYTEDTPTAPLSVYGESKRAGELNVIETGANAAILRTSWVFSRHGKNFVKTMMKLGAERSAVNVVDDQRGKPTPARFVAEAMLTAVRVLRLAPENKGVYHVAGDETVSWADFAEAIFTEAGLKTAVNRIPTSDYPTPARRPAYSTLDTSRFERSFGLKPPSWRRELAAVVAALKSSV